LKALQLLTADEIARINGLGESLAEGIRHALTEIGIAGQITGAGSLHTVHLTDRPVRDYRSMATSHKMLHRLLHLGLLNRGMFSAKRGMLVVSTPMSQADIDGLVSAFADTLDELKPYIMDEAPHLLL
jgi:glutamate-1-semialdehyde 2,1-aminomutase